MAQGICRREMKMIWRTINQRGETDGSLSWVSVWTGDEGTFSSSSSSYAAQPEGEAPSVQVAEWPRSARRRDWSKPNRVANALVAGDKPWPGKGAVKLWSDSGLERNPPGVGGRLCVD